MLQSVWSCLRRRRSTPPARDIFDADLDRARRKPGCALCRLVREHDQQVMHSFLWEYCTDPHIGARISKSWGFCSYHTWSLGVLEHERIGDGLGIGIVYQALLRQLDRLLPSKQPARRRSILTALPIRPEIGTTSCRFCQLARHEEFQFLTRLIHRFQQSISSGDEREWSSLQTVLCFPHMKRLLHACAEGVAFRQSPWQLMGLFQGKRDSLTDDPQRRETQAMATRFMHYTAQRVNEQNHALQATPIGWSQIAEHLELLVGGLQALPIHVSTKTQQAIPRHLLLVTGQRSQLQSPDGETCPACAAEASACIAKCLSTFTEGEPLSSTAAFCQSHHWILAASIVVQQQDNADRYYSWLERQLEEQYTKLANARAYRDIQDEQNCAVCSYASEIGSEAIGDIVQGLRQTDDGLTNTEEKMLCLFHWRKVQESCAREADAFTLQERLLQRQRQHLLHLDMAVEAYLARFSASRRERGEVPDVSGAAWAWERLLAFFAGEPTLEYTLSG